MKVWGKFTNGCVLCMEVVQSIGALLDVIGVTCSMEQKPYYLFWAYLDVLSVFNMFQIHTLNDN
jgi:hypothetical protein